MSHTLRKAVPATALALWTATVVLAADAPSVALAGPGGKTQTVGIADLSKLPGREVTVDEPHGKSRVRYRGAELPAVLSLVGPAMSETLRGPALAAYVLVEAADDYRVAFSLAELHTKTGSTDAILAYEREGQPIAGETGPFRLLVPTDKRGARWVRQVARITVVQP